MYWSYDKQFYDRRKIFVEVREEIRTLVGALDTPFWRDAVLHHVADMEADLDGAVAAWMADPAFTRTEYIVFVLYLTNVNCKQLNGI